MRSIGAKCANKARGALRCAAMLCISAHRRAIGVMDLLIDSLGVVGFATPLAYES